MNFPINMSEDPLGSELADLKFNSSDSCGELEGLQYERRRTKLLENDSDNKSLSSSETSSISSPVPLSLPAKRFRRGFTNSTSSHHQSVFIPRKIEKSSQDVSFLCSSLSSSFIFSSLDYPALVRLIQTFYPKIFVKGSNILHKTDASAELFVIKTGRIRIDIANDVYEEVGPGKVLGEIALLHDSPQLIEATAVEDCECWALDRDTFVNMVKVSSMANREKHRKALQKAFFGVEAELIDDLIDACRVEVYCTGEYIAKKGESGDKVFVIVEGVAKGKSGKNFDVVKEKVFNESVVADCTVKCLTVKLEAIKRILGQDYLT
jgi:hypothetical protein